MEIVGAKNLNAFLSSVATHKGYYFGRYEAGDPSATEERGTNTYHGTDEPMVCKAGIQPYKHVTQPIASRLSQAMYNNENLSFTSDLINSYTWDTTLVFIQKCSGDEDYSASKALQNTVTLTGMAQDANGNKDVRCNIYDMAGNVHECSTETYTKYDSVQGFSPSVFRGGHAEVYTASRRTYGKSNGIFRNLAFRPILYFTK